MGKRYKMNTTTGKQEQVDEQIGEQANTSSEQISVQPNTPPAVAVGEVMQGEVVKEETIVKEADDMAVRQEEVAVKQAEEAIKAVETVVTQTSVQSVNNIFIDAIVGEIKAYCEDMKPGKPLGKDAYKKEQGMYNAFLSVLNNCPADQFAATWKAIIDQVAKPESAALGDKYALRCASQWTLSANHYQNYQALLGILHISALSGVEGNVRKRMDLDRALAKFPEAARNKLISYYM